MATKDPTSRRGAAQSRSREGVISEGRSGHQSASFLEAPPAAQHTFLDDQDVADGLAAVESTFSRPDTHGVCVVDGYGVRLRVSSGELEVRDGLGPNRRERRYSRVASGLRRVVVLGTGTISSDSLRWCREVGVSIAVLDASNTELLMTSASGTDDGRLRRQQARALDGSMGLDIAKTLLLQKVAGQGRVARQLLHRPDVGDAIEAIAAALEVAGDLPAVRSLESDSSRAYWSGWADNPETSLRFATRDVSRKRIPPHWTRWETRRSLLGSGASNRRAERPLNAVLSFGYRMAEIAARRACLGVGLDCGMGILHMDKAGRDSMVLDILEVARPAVDAFVLEQAAQRTWRRSDFHQTGDGHVRLLMPVTHDLAESLARWEQEVGPWAEWVAHRLSEGVETSITQKTPLTRSNAKAAQARVKARKAVSQLGVRGAGRTDRRGTPVTAQGLAGCVDCGDPVTMPRRVRCDRCIAADPRQAAESRGRRAAAIGSRKRRQVEWEAAHPDQPYDPDYFSSTIRPGLATVKLSAMVEATGLSKSFCSNVRAGKSTPHVSHWSGLASLVDASRAVTPTPYH